MLITMAPGLIPMVWVNVLQRYDAIAVNAALDLAFIGGYAGYCRPCTFINARWVGANRKAAGATASTLLPQKSSRSFPSCTPS